MSALKDALVTAAAAYGPLDALIAGRVFPMGKAPRGRAKPWLTYQTVTVDRPETLAGHEGPVTAWLQLDAWSETQAEADAVKDAAVAMLGAASDARALGGLAIRWARCGGDRDGWEPYGDGTDAGCFRVGFDARVCYCEG